MTREAELLIDMWDILHRECHKVVTKENYDVIKKAIKALEQESVLDKARAEIAFTMKYQYAVGEDEYAEGFEKSLKIIDKCIAESEVIK